MTMTVRVLIVAAAAALAGQASAAPPQIKIPPTVQLPQLEPLVPTCSDPAADHFLEVDISKRAPADATKVQRLSAWVTNDGVFHWPFVMRIRNIGDTPFSASKPGAQSVIVTEDDLTAGKKGRVVGSTVFDQIPAHSGVAVRFEFTAAAADVEKGKFHRIYTLSIKYDNQDEALINGRFGDCNLNNNKFFVEFDGSRKGWIFGK
jgi:hypothetical protein